MLEFEHGKISAEMKVRILVVSVEPLWPSTHGGRIRTAKIAETLASNDFHVRVISPERPGSIRGEAPANLDAVSLKWRPPRHNAARLHWLPWLGTYSLPQVIELQAEIDEFQPDFIYWSHSYLAVVGMRKIRTQAKHVVEFANIEKDRFLSIAKRGRSRHRLSALLEFIKACVWEPVVARRADLCVAISETDRTALQAKGALAVTVENALVSHGGSLSPDSHVLLSVANWEYAPNRDGINEFLLNHWGNVIRVIPEARLLLVGKGSEDVCKGLDGLTNVEALGYVGDLAAVYREAALFLAPARSGAGSQLKVAEALGHSRCVVGPAFLGREERLGLPIGALSASDATSEVVIEGLLKPIARRKVEREISGYARLHDWQFETAVLRVWLKKGMKL